MKLKALPLLLMLGVAATTAFTQNHPKALEDPLLDELVGTWAMNGTLLGEEVEYSLKADWVLGHQFLLLDMLDVADPPQYEAAIYIGFDSKKNQYVVHWLDLFGGRPSATLGWGDCEGDRISLVFEYSSGQFRDIFTFNRESGHWKFLIENQTSDGNWSVFADYEVAR